MSVGINLTGRAAGPEARDPDGWLERVKAWAPGACGETLVFLKRAEEEGCPVLYIGIHPAEDPIRLRIGAEGRVTVAARTCGAGPGYHIYVCQLLRQLGADLGVTWDPPGDEKGDDTGYLYLADRDALEEKMLDWLGGLAGVLLLAHRAGSGSNAYQISLPLNTYLYFHDGLIATPLGPRDEAWLAHAAADPRHGLDLFAWWQEGVDASYFLTRALSQIWTDARWREPLTDEERALLEDVIRSLDRAHGLDPSLDYPWLEWREILGYLGREVPPEVEAGANSEAVESHVPMGYRRRKVEAYPFRGWRIEVPGSFAEGWEEGSRWHAWEPGRHVRLSSVTYGPEEGSPPVPGPSLEELVAQAPWGEGGTPFTHRAPRLVSKAVLTRETDDHGKRYHLLRGAIATPGYIGILTIEFEDDAHRYWALDTWRSISRSTQKVHHIPGVGEIGIA